MEAPTESIFRIDSSFPSDRLGSVVFRAICDVQSLHFCVFILERVKFYKNKKKTQLHKRGPCMEDTKRKLSGGKNAEKAVLSFRSRYIRVEAFEFTALSFTSEPRLPSLSRVQRREPPRTLLRSRDFRLISIVRVALPS